MQDTIQVDNKTIGWLVVQRGFEIPSFNFITEREDVKGKAGSAVKNRYLNDIESGLPLIVRNEKLSPGGEKTHDSILETLVKFFNIEDLAPKGLKFKSQNWYWFACFDGPLKLPRDPRGSVKFTIEVVLTDPCKCSITGSKNTAISGQVSVTDGGTADTPLIVEARAVKPSSYFMITKNDEGYSMVGDNEVTKGVKDYIPPVYHSKFRDFKGWTKMITEDIPNDDLDGKVGGDFMISNLGEGYKATSFPGVKGWVSAGTKRGLLKAMTDSQITYKCIVEQKGKGAGRTTQHIYDSDSELLASIDYENKYHDREIEHIVVTLYNQKRDSKRIYDYQNKLIMYNLDRVVIYMRLRRVSDKFSTKTWKFDHIKGPDRREPIDMDEKEWIGGGRFYQRPASVIAIYSAKYKGYKWMEVNGLGSFNTGILPESKGAKDVIIQKGDLVKIDIQTRGVIINEGPMLSKRSSGSDYFNVDFGYGELIIQLENAFDTMVKWQDRRL